MSFHLNCDPYGDHVVTVEGRAVVDLEAAPSDVHPEYRAKYRAPLEHWGMDEAETAAAFSVAGPHPPGALPGLVSPPSAGPPPSSSRRRAQRLRLQLSRSRTGVP